MKPLKTLLIILLAFNLPALNLTANEHAEPNVGYLEAEKDAIQFNNYMFYKIIREGSEQPSNKEIKRFLVDIWNKDGEQIANSADDGLSASRPDDLRSQYPFLAEALAATPEGATYRWWISAAGIPEIEQGFPADDYMLELSVKDTVDPFPAPSNVAAIPSEADLTDAGVGYMILESNETGQHPTIDDLIEVHIVGWQTDGNMFYNTYLQEQPATFPLGVLIAGWQDVVPLMKVGEKMRIWIPGDLAYDKREDRPHSPRGMLVFDIDLISIPGPAPITDG